MKKIWIILFALVGLISCQSTQEITGAHVNQAALNHKAFNKVCVLALLPKEDLKYKVETQVVKAMKHHGTNAVSSIDVMPNKVTSLKSIKVQVLDSVLTASNCDALFIVSLLDTKSESKYIRNKGKGSTPNFSYKYYDNYQSYYSYRNSEMNHEGTIIEETTYVIESVMYDVEANQYVWSVQSDALQPSSIKSWMRSYSKLMVEKLDEMVHFQE